MSTFAADFHDTFVLFGVDDPLNKMRLRFLLLLIQMERDLCPVAGESLHHGQLLEFVHQPG